MQLKLDTNGNAVLKDGMPVYIADGKEIALDAAAIVKERDSHKLMNMFHESRFVHEAFDWPADMVGSMLGESFRFEGGKPVAYVNGQKLYSRERPGEIASFEESIGLLAKNSPHADTLFRKAGAAGSAVPAQSGELRGGNAVSRRDFEALTPQARMAHIKAGGSVFDGSRA
jgi:hypothetical protein